MSLVAATVAVPAASAAISRAEEAPMDQEDIFCPRDVDAKDWEHIGQWIYESGNPKCQSCSHKKKCARINNGG